MPLSIETYQKAAANLTQHTGVEWKVGFSDSDSAPCSIFTIVKTELPRRQFEKFFLEKHNFVEELKPLFSPLTLQTSAEETVKDGDFQKPGLEKHIQVSFNTKNTILAISNGILTPPFLTEFDICNAVDWLKMTTGINWNVNADNGFVMYSNDFLDKNEYISISDNLQKIFDQFKKPFSDSIQVEPLDLTHRGVFRGMIAFSGKTMIKEILTIAKSMEEEQSLAKAKSMAEQARAEHSSFAMPTSFFQAPTQPKPASQSSRKQCAVS